MNAPRFRVFDPLANEWAGAGPSVRPMLEDAAKAAIFDSKAAAIIRSRELIGPDRPLLIMQPICPCCGGIADHG